MSGPHLIDRVKETTVTTGTGALTLGGAVAGFQSFAAVGDANSCYYAIVHRTAFEWEVGIGTYTLSGTLLSRDSVLQSSNGNNPVNFSAGTKDVFITIPGAVVEALIAKKTVWQLVDSEAVGADQAAVTFTDLDYAELMVVIDAVTAALSSGRRLQVSVDDGSNWLSTIDFLEPGGTIAVVDFLAFHTGSNTAARSGMVQIYNANRNTEHKLALMNTRGGTGTIKTTSVINAVRVITSSGNMTGGNVFLYARI